MGYRYPIVALLEREAREGASREEASVKRQGSRGLAAQATAPETGFGPAEQRVRFTGRVDGLNEMLRDKRKRRSRSDVYGLRRKQDLLRASIEIRAAGIQPVSRVFLRFVWIEPNRRRDPDNVAAGGRKLILDALAAANVLRNDGWSEIAGWEDSWRLAAKGEHPGCELVILRCDGARP